jgi:hypothetical protein
LGTILIDVEKSAPVKSFAEYAVKEIIEWQVAIRSRVAQNLENRRHVTGSLTYPIYRKAMKEGLSTIKD